MPDSPRALGLPSSVLLGSGGLALTVALGADAAGFGGQAGLGWRQLLLAFGGVVLMGFGVRASAPGRAWFARTLGDADRMAARQCLLVAVWFGLVTGIVEVVHLVVRYYGFDIIPRQPAHVVWMAPVSHLLLALVLGAVFSIAAVVRSPLATVPAVVFGFGLLMAWSQSMFYPWLDSGAALILSVAMAAVLVRAITLRERTFLCVVRRTLPWLSGLVVVGAVTVPVSRTLSESLALARIPAARADSPNVLLIVLDTVRADNVSVNGYARDTTPNIAALAERGVVFDWAIAPAPWTLPSHATMFTGHYQHDLSVDWLVALDDSFPTLAETLADLGYVTGGFAGNVSYCERGFGLARGFAHYEDFYVEPSVLAFSTALGARLMGSNKVLRWDRWLRNDAETITDRFLDWVSSTGDQPFFAFVNYFDAHALYAPPEGYDAEFGPLGPVIHELPDARPRTGEEIDQLVNAYDGCIRYIDDHIGRLMRKLETRGRLRDTWVIVTSDHGEQFGEHGLMGHANSLYRPLLHVPLVIVPPGGLPTAARVSPVVSLRDLPATILDVVGAGERRLPGHSLRPLWTSDGHPTLSPALAEVRGAINAPPRVPAARGAMGAVFAEGLHYIRNGDGLEELYDLARDPLEEHNLIDARPAAAAAARAAFTRAGGQ